MLLDPPLLETPLLEAGALSLEAVPVALEARPRPIDVWLAVIIELL